MAEFATLIISLAQVVELVVARMENFVEEVALHRGLQQNAVPDVVVAHFGD